MTKTVMASSCRFRIAIFFWFTLSITGVLTTSHKPDSISMELVRTLQRDVQTAIEWNEAAAGRPFSFDSTEEDMPALDSEFLDNINAQGYANHTEGAPPIVADEVDNLDPHPVQHGIVNLEMNEGNHPVEGAPFDDAVEVCNVVPHPVQHGIVNPGINRGNHPVEGAPPNDEGASSNDLDEVDDMDPHPVQRGVVNPGMNVGNHPDIRSIIAWCKQM